jgi:glycosyltransferase involved in cell wall biosynthesis
MIKPNFLFIFDDWIFPESKSGAHRVIANLTENNSSYNASLVYLNSSNEVHTIPQSHSQMGVASIARTKKLSKYRARLRWIASINPYIAQDQIGITALSQYIAINFKFYDLIFLASMRLAPVIDKLCTPESSKLVLLAGDCLSLLFKRRLDESSKLIEYFAFRAEIYKLQRFERKYVKEYFKTIFFSSEDKRFVCDQFKISADKIIDIPIGVDNSYFNPASFEAINRNRKQIVFVGQYGYAPNLSAAFFLVNEVLPNLLELDPEFKLVLIGGSPPHSLVVMRNRYVEVTGFVDDLRPLLAESSVFVSPLGWGGAGAKNKVLEAMSMGMAVLGSKVSLEGIPFNNGEDAILVHDLNSVVWARAIFDLTMNKDLIRKMGVSARKNILKNRTWDIMRRNIASLIVKDFSRVMKL